MSNERLPGNVDSVLTQYRIVQETTSITSYENFHNRYFKSPDLFLDKVFQEQSDRKPGVKTDEEYFKFLSFVGIQGAQFGYPRLEGQVLYMHNGRDYKKPVTHAFHQLALGSHVGYLNEQVYPHKKEVADKADGDSDVYWGAWGTLYKSRKGQLLDPENVYYRKFDAQWRSDDSRQICLPYREFNQNMASLEFTPDIADKMTVKDFEKEVYPQVRQALDGLIDTETVFLRDPKNQERRVSYSLR